MVMTQELWTKLAYSARRGLSSEKEVPQACGLSRKWVLDEVLGLNFDPGATVGKLNRPLGARLVGNSV